MSPEQLKLEDANEQSDLFSIAIILIELLTGRNPLAGASYAEASLGPLLPICVPFGSRPKHAF